MNLFSAYSALAHRTFFKDLSLIEIARDLSKSIDELPVGGKQVYLYHSDSVKFVVAFLLLLDKGAMPICLSSSKMIYEDTASFFDGNWVGKKILMDSPYKEEAYCVLTSGTTGIPKRCEFLLKNAKGNALSHAQAFEMKSDEEIIQTLPTYHSYGIIAYILTPLVTGCSVNFCPGQMGIRSVAKNPSAKNYILHASPAQVRFILNDKFAEHGVLKKITIGGGAITFGELKKLKDKFPGCDFYVSYGLTEAGPRVSAGKFLENLPFQSEDYWIGKAIMGVELKILDGAGHLGVSSPYLKVNLNPEELIEGKWYPTRDQVKLLSGDILFLSRDGDLLKFGGVTIYPKDIEDQVRKWDGVKDALILKKPDKVYEDLPYLFVEGAISENEVLEKLEKEVAQGLLIKKVIVMESFPRQSLDKVDRKKLQEIIDG